MKRKREKDAMAGDTAGGIGDAAIATIRGKKRKKPTIVIPSDLTAWLRANFVANPSGNIPKEVIYHQYEIFCHDRGMIPKTHNIFGKILKQIFPNLESRRLGPIGQLVSHYSGIVARGTGGGTAAAVAAANQISKGIIRRSKRKFLEEDDEEDDEDSGDFGLELQEEDDEDEDNNNSGAPGDDGSKKEERGKKAKKEADARGGGRRKKAAVYISNCEKDLTEEEKEKEKAEEERNAKGPRRGRSSREKKKRRGGDDDDYDYRDEIDEEDGDEDYDDGDGDYVDSTKRQVSSSSASSSPKKFEERNNSRNKIKHEAEYQEEQQQRQQYGAKGRAAGYPQQQQQQQQQEEEGEEAGYEDDDEEYEDAEEEEEDGDALPARNAFCSLSSPSSSSATSSPLAVATGGGHLPPYPFFMRNFFEEMKKGRVQTSVSLSAKKVLDEFEATWNQKRKGEYTWVPPRSEEYHLLRVLQVSKYVEIYSTTVWPFAPLPSSVLDDGNLEYFMATNEGTRERSVLTMAINFALFLGSAYWGNFAHSKEYYMNALDSLTYVHDELNMTVALMLLHLSYGSKYFYEDNSLALNLIHVALSICEALNAKDTEFYDRCVGYEAQLTLEERSLEKAYQAPRASYEVIGNYSEYTGQPVNAMAMVSDVISILSNIVIALQLFAKGNSRHLTRDLKTLEKHLDAAYHTICAAERTCDLTRELAFFPKFWTVVIIASVRLAVGEVEEAVSAGVLCLDLLEDWNTQSPSGSSIGCEAYFDLLGSVFFRTNNFTLLSRFVSILENQGLFSQLACVRQTIRKWRMALLQSEFRSGIPMVTANGEQHMQHVQQQLSQLTPQQQQHTPQQQQQHLPHPLLHHYQLHEPSPPPQPSPLSIDIDTTVSSRGQDLLTALIEDMARDI